jgi:hypothetical protein
MGSHQECEGTRAAFMIEARGENRSSYITGPSKFNTRYMITNINQTLFRLTLLLFLLLRIERLWRDAHSKVIKFYLDIFMSLEKDGFDISDEVHRFLLQYLFQSRIQEELNQFINTWNRHKLSTEGNKSPMQLVVANMNKFPFVDELENLELFGLENDSDLEVDLENELPAVNCPRNSCPLSVANFIDFKQRISPLTLDTTPVF